MIVTLTESNMISEQSMQLHANMPIHLYIFWRKLSLNDKLEGSFSYRTWIFSMKMSLLTDDLWNCAIGDDKDNSKDQRALAKLCLDVPPCCLFTC